MSEDVFHALASPARRRLLELLTDGPRTAGDLATEFEMSRPSVAEHLRILRSAELVRDRAVGRQRVYRLEPAPLEQVSQWLHPFERFWRARLRDMVELLEGGGPVSYSRTGTVHVDQFIGVPPAKVWLALTNPDLHAKWWAPGDISAEVGHEFHLWMPGFGSIRCKVLESQPFERFVYTFNDNWTLSWRLFPEGRGTRLLLEHSGFDLDDKRQRDACDRMGPGWRDEVLPALAKLAPEIE